MAPVILAMLAAAWGWGSVSFDGWPPARFQTMPAKPAEIVFGRRIINRECGRAQLPNVIEACTEPDANLIVMPNPCEFPRSENYARLLCHEIAHLPPNNWPDNHPR